MASLNISNRRGIEVIELIAEEIDITAVNESLEPPVEMDGPVCTRFESLVKAMHQMLRFNP